MNRYSKEVTQSIPYYGKYKVALKDLLKTEGVKEQITICDNPQVIDMDTCKDSINRTCKSVDMVFVCERNKIQLPECKYRIKKEQSLREGELNAKVSDTKDILTTPDSNGTYATQCLLLVSDQLVQSAKNHLNRLYAPKTPNKQPFKVMTTSDFIQEYFGE